MYLLCMYLSMFDEDLKIHSPPFSNDPRILFFFFVLPFQSTKTLCIHAKREIRVHKAR